MLDFLFKPASLLAPPAGRGHQTGTLPAGKPLICAARRKLFRPDCLTSYIALSAIRTSCAGCRVSAGYMAMPMLAPTRKVTLPSRIEIGRAHV